MSSQGGRHRHVPGVADICAVLSLWKSAGPHPFAVQRVDAGRRMGLEWLGVRVTVQESLGFRVAHPEPSRRSRLAKCFLERHSTQA
jgi:hypothetical protein